MSCEHKEIEAALDRWQESHWHLHQIEQHYHHADNLRYSMNAFIRSLREIPDMVTRSIQKPTAFNTWHKIIKDELIHNDPLTSNIFKKRNFVVHQSMLIPESQASVAAVIGLKIKMAYKFKIDPFEDSDEAMARFQEYAQKYPFLKLLIAPDDVQLLSILREWHIEGIDNEIIEAFRKAWLRVGEYLSDVLEYIGGERLPVKLPTCFKDPRNFYYKKYPHIQYR